MKIDEMLHQQSLVEAVNQGYVSIRNHPQFPELCIANYTQEAVYNNVWTQVTRSCRGLIWNSETHEVLARPFEKFWSADQLEGRPELGTVPTSGHFFTFDKVDGSLGILYSCPDGSEGIATRGSFESEQAIKATEMWHEKYEDVCTHRQRDDITFLFEIVYPQNRIVLDYGDTEELVLLGGVFNETGKNLSPMAAQWELQFPGNQAAEYKSKNLGLLMQTERPGKEGYVLWWPEENFRLKIKHEEYKRIHAVVFGANTKNVWKALAAGDNPVPDGLPDEFMPPIEKYVEKLRKRFLEISANILMVWELASSLSTRKAQAEYLSKYGDKTIRSGVFRRLDGKSYDDVIWKALEPERAEPIW